MDRPAPTVRPSRWILCLALALALLGSAVACGPAEEEAAGPDRAAEVAALEQEEAALAEARAELAALRDRLEQARAGELEEEVDVAELEQQIATQEAEIAELSEAFYGNLVEFLNADPPIEGEPMTAEQEAALRMKSGEDLLIGREYIERGGDYARALDIYQAALAADPSNADLTAAIEDAESMRYVTQERFDQVEKGMSRAEVREILGPVNLRNVRDYEDRGVLLWVYPKNAEKEAAGIYFRKKGERYEVYRLEYDLSGGGQEA